MPSGYSVSHQKIAIDVDPQSKRVAGSTEISVVPLDPILKTLAFNARGLTVHRVSVNGRNASFKNHDASKSKMAPTSTVFQHEMLRDKILDDGGEPYELVITLPKGVKPELYKSSSDGVRGRFQRKPSEAAASSPQPSTPVRDGPTSIYEAMTVLIEFEAFHMHGVAFVGTAEKDLRYPQVFTTHSPIAEATRTWVPCLDGLWNLCSWEISLSIPRTIRDIERAPQVSLPETNGVNGTTNGTFHDDDEMELDENDDGRLELTAVCSGDFVDEGPHSFNPYKKVIKYALAAPTPAQHLSFAIGPFYCMNLSDFRETEEDDAMGSIAVDVLTYSLPRRSQLVKNTCLFLYKAVDFFVREFGSYPFTSFKLCFVDDAVSDCISSASMAICSNRLLFSSDIIDTLYASTKTLTMALATQWSGVNILPATWEDSWATIGIAGFMTHRFLRRLMGNNDYRFRMKQDSDRICNTDIQKLPIGQPDFTFPLTHSAFQFIELKAPVVFFILDRRMSKGGANLGLNRVISKIFLSFMTGGLLEPTLNTAYLQRTCEKVSHQKLDTFFQQWVYGSGYPCFSVVQRFNKKKMIVELGIRQMQSTETPPASITDESFLNDAVRYFDQKPAPAGSQTFMGPMTIRIHEADGTPYEHVIQIKGTFTKLDIPYNTKYRRLGRRGQRARNRGSSDGDHGSEEVLLHCLGDVLETEEDIANWRLSEWSMDEEAKMNAEAFEWIRLDADFEWICRLTVNQPEYMFLSQLQQDRDVVAHYEAIDHFKYLKATSLTSTILVRTLFDERYYYGIRCQAALGLARCGTAELDWIGLFHLIKCFQHFYGFEGSTIPRANDFTDIAGYFVKCAIPTAMSRVRDVQGTTPLRVRKALFDFLRFNENSSNPYSDCFWISLLTKELANALVSSQPPSAYGFNFDFEDPEDSKLIQSALSEIERYQRMDRWIPSFGNVLTKGALEAKQTLSKITSCLDFREVLMYTRESNIDTVRAQAFMILVQQGALRNGPLTRYIFQSLLQTESYFVMDALVRCLQVGVGALALHGQKEVKIVPAADEMIIEEDTTETAQIRKEQIARATVEGAILALRTELNSNELFQAQLWAVLVAGKLNHAAMRTLLDVSRIAFDFHPSLIVKLAFRNNRPRLVATSMGKGKVVIRKQKPLAPPKAPLKIKLRMGG